MKTRDCPEVSVIIPTYQRPLSLIRALDSLQKQVTQRWEVLIVDNEANSDIEHLVLRKQADFSARLKYVAEPTLGLHFARHAGVHVAQGKLLVFTDDDATFEADAIRAYVKAFASYPHMVAAGGPVRPRWEADPPEWLRLFMKDNTVFPILSIHDSRNGFSLSSQNFFFGVNMAIRRSVLFEVGGFNPDSFGTIWLGDGETGLNRKLSERNMLVGHVPDAVVYHHIPAERMTVEYFQRRMANEGACDMYTRFHRRMPGKRGLEAIAAIMKIRNGMARMIEPLVAGRTDPWPLRIQLRAARWRVQLDYITRLMHDRNFREFVLVENWLNAPCTSR